MEINNSLRKAIPPILNKKRALGFWWLNISDVFALGITVIIAALISIPVFIFAGLWGFFPLLIILCIGGISIIKIGDTSFHILFLVYFLWLVRKKKYDQKELSIIDEKSLDNETNVVEYINGEKVYLFEIIGCNTSNFGDMEINHFQETLKQFFNNTFDFAIYKLDIPFNFENFTERAKLIVDKKLQEKYLSFLQEKIVDEISDEHKTFLILKNMKSENMKQIARNLASALSSENVELIPADQYSKKFILQKVFFHSLRIVDVH
uniref:hypothetical protein n=1 Tax=[Mycoplasma] testudinis TaxID=33924 RepID=UPI00056D42C7